MKKVIFHIDVNSAFLSWEAIHRLRSGESQDLRDVASAVGGDATKRRGVILAKSMEAKRYGVKTGESIMEARKKCPQLLIVPPNHQLYEVSSGAFMEILREYSPDVEPYSIDEAFVDMTGMEALLGDLVSVAEGIRERIYRELGFTVNIGVASNKLLAKMASDFRKPNMVHTLFDHEIESKMWPLPVRELFFVGRATEEKLASLGIKTIGDLARSDLNLIRKHLKKHGEVVWNFANGFDTSLVETEQIENKGYGNSTTIAFDVTDDKTAKVILLSLAETVTARLRSHHVKAELLSVSIKDFRFKTVSHQMVMTTATDITAEIYQASCVLFDQLWDGTPIRLLGIHTGRLREGGARQLSIFDQTDYEKLEKLDQAVDSIRSRFGSDAMMRAAFLERPGIAKTDIAYGKNEVRDQDTGDTE